MPAAMPKREAVRLCRFERVCGGRIVSGDRWEWMMGEAGDRYLCVVDYGVID